MEYLVTKPATKTTPAERIAVPDVVVSASHHRDLVDAFAAAKSDAERSAIVATARERDAADQKRIADEKARRDAEAAKNEAAAKPAGVPPVNAEELGATK